MTITGKFVLKTWHEKFKEVSQEVIVESRKTTTVNFELKKKKIILIKVFLNKKRLLKFQ